MMEPVLENWAAAASGPVQYAVEEGLVFVDCNQRDRFQPLKFMVAQYWITVDPDDYTWDVDGDNSLCLMLLAENNYNFWIFGQPVFQNYYTIHSMEDSTITFGPLVDSGKAIPTLGVIPDEILRGSKKPGFVKQYGSSLYMFIVLVIAVFALEPGL